MAAYCRPTAQFLNTALAKRTFFHTLEYFHFSSLPTHTTVEKKTSQCKIIECQVKGEMS